MSDPIFGINIQRVDNEARPAVVSDMSIVGLVGTAPEADAAVFPANTPVLIYSDDAAKLLALGDTGTLPDAIQGINDQLGEFQVAARVVVVRIEEGDDDDETLENVIGSAADKAGIYALLEAGPVLGVIPRLIGIPGFTEDTISGLEALAITGAGSALTEAPAVGFTGGGNDPDKVLPTAEAVLGTGGNADKVVALNILTAGSKLAAPLTVTFTGGGDDENKVLPTATATVGTLANPVVAALIPVLEKLLAHAVVDGPANSLQAFTDWRETIQSSRIIPVGTAVKVGVAAEVQPASPRVIGIGVRRDHEFGGRPFHSWANQPVQGIVGPNRAINSPSPMAVPRGSRSSARMAASSSAGRWAWRAPSPRAALFMSAPTMPGRTISGASTT